MDEFIIDDQAKLWKYLGLELKETSGQFEWKLRCPLPMHHGNGQDGRERTPSFCVTKDNRYYCFGCGGFGSVVDLISLVQGIPQIEVMRSLAIKIGLIDKNGKWDEEMLQSMPEKSFTPIDPEKTIDPWIQRSNMELYNYIKNFVGTPEFEKEFLWFEKVGAKIDELLEHTGHKDWEYAKELYEKLKSSIEKRRKV